MHTYYRPIWQIVRAGLIVVLLMATAVTITAQSDDPASIPPPDSVTIAGSVQPAIGCSGEWNTTCTESALEFNAANDLWMATFDLPAGTYEYKAALNGSWDDNYGLNAEYYGENIPLDVAEETAVTFWYDHKTRWVSDSINSLIANVPGDFQEEIGCSGDWQPDCLRSQLQDPNGDGIYTLTTALIPAGDYEAKVAINQSWTENYGADGTLDGGNIPFSVGEEQAVIFAYDPATHLLTIEASDDVPDDLATEVTGDSGGSLPPAAAPFPDRVVVPGTIQSVVGCSGDWQTDCANTELIFDEEDQLWFGSFDIPAGEYEYKVALNGTWDVNFGQDAAPGGANIPLSLAEDSTVEFYFDHKTGWVADSATTLIANIPGDFQDEIGCSGDWQPDCLATWLQDPDGDGFFTFLTKSIPVGEFEAKVAFNQDWTENYGEAGALDGANIPFSVTEADTLVTFTFDSRSNLLTIATGASGGIQGNINQRRAHWIGADTIAWDVEHEAGNQYFFHYDPRGNLFSLGVDGINGGEAIPLTVDENGFSDEQLAKFPHLRNFTPLKFNPDDLGVVRIALKGLVAVSAQGSDGQLLDASGLQIAGALDDLYPYDGELGVSVVDGVPTLRVWAPTARLVRLHLFDDANPNSEATVQPMRIDPKSGVWSIDGNADWMGNYYLYEVEVFVPSESSVQTNLVTDPYSFNLSQNSSRSHIVDLHDVALAPDGWAEHVTPDLAAPEDIVVYELHMRDFSVNDASVPAELRGTYSAFTVADSNGMQHLAALSAAGLTHLHLLPTFDLATIEEDKSAWETPSFDDLAAFGADAEDQQAMLSEIRDLDPFNWGYDPWHYTVPEGSYATDANGTTRIVEYREMVQSLHETGLRVVMDVVYNHTNASGQNEKSVLDRIVPGYYHRLNATGKVETSTCCQNTATEHDMMRKLMVDSVVTWATMYRVDGFRFDLMGHHMKADMLAVRDALDGLTMEVDGVDGRSITIYGEGWNFGEVADGARGINATQNNMAGTGIGTFNDRLRDAVRGGSPFGGRTEQGFINGLYNAPNDFDQGAEIEQKLNLLGFADLIRVGLVGNLAEYELVNENGDVVNGRLVLYNGSGAGYTADPQENIVYVSKHDNETLFDIIQYKAPPEADTALRTRMQNLGNDIVMLSQGIPFFQAGDDMLRSKSLDRNSYNSGDWFNRLDFTYQSNNWGIGLPPSADNQEQWPLMQPILAADGLTPTPEDIQFAVTHFQEMLQIRQSSPLFRLQTAVQVQERLQFHNTGPDQIPGLIVMSISDTVGDDLDPNSDGVVVLFNATPEQQIFEIESLANARFELHPVQANSADAKLQEASYEFEVGTFVVPAWTMAVYVAPQSEQVEIEAISEVEEPIEEVEEADTSVAETAEEHVEETADDAHAEEMDEVGLGDDAASTPDDNNPFLIWLGAIGGGLLLSLLIAWLSQRRK